MPWIITADEHRQELQSALERLLADAQQAATPPEPPEKPQAPDIPSAHQAYPSARKKHERELKRYDEALTAYKQELAEFERTQGKKLQDARVSANKVTQQYDKMLQYVQQILADRNQLGRMEAPIPLEFVDQHKLDHLPGLIKDLSIAIDRVGESDQNKVMLLQRLGPQALVAHYEKYKEEAPPVPKRLSEGRLKENIAANQKAMKEAFEEYYLLVEQLSEDLKPLLGEEAKQTVVYFRPWGAALFELIEKNVVTPEKAREEEIGSDKTRYSLHLAGIKRLISNVSSDLNKMMMEFYGGETTLFSVRPISKEVEEDVRVLARKIMDLMYEVMVDLGLEYMHHEIATPRLDSGEYMVSRMEGKGEEAHRVPSGKI